MKELESLRSELLTPGTHSAPSQERAKAISEEILKSITDDDLRACIKVLGAVGTPGGFTVLQRFNPDLDPDLIDQARFNLKIACPMLEVEDAVARAIG